MGKKLYSEQLRMLVEQIESIKREHPKADVFYNVELDQVQITYPLPKDFYKLKDFKIDYEK